MTDFQRQCSLRDKPLARRPLTRTKTMTLAGMTLPAKAKKALKRDANADVGFTLTAITQLRIKYTNSRQKVGTLIDDFTNAKARCGAGNNPAAKSKLAEVRARVREMTSPAAELSAVARWRLLLRNDPQLSRLVG